MPYVYNVKVIRRSCIIALLILSACGGKSAEEVSGGVSGVLSLNQLEKVLDATQIRSAALLGIFTSNFIAGTQGSSIITDGPFDAIAIQNSLIKGQRTTTDPDYDLLSAFSEALQVDLQDLLNRSTDREKTLSAYTEALNNVADRAHARFKELSSMQRTVQTERRNADKIRSNHERAIRKAIQLKDFNLASEEQRLLAESQNALKDIDLEFSHNKSILETMSRLLAVYGDRILAMQQNREVLIAGLSIIDSPGIKDFSLVKKIKIPQRKSGTDAKAFDKVFQYRDSLDGKE